MKRMEGSAAYLVPAVFAMSTAVGVFIMVAALAFDDRAMLGDPGVRWKVVGALATVSALVVAVFTLVLKGWEDLRERRRREGIVSIEVEGLAPGDTFEGVVLPGGALRLSARRPLVLADDKVVSLVRTPAGNGAAGPSAS